ncbi:sensor histidine kinase [Desulfosediminicola sp.]|uniref:sensor histidine kinase n=1 Tax=Desulfosediminicola sp. TaxID=2886825 RepID=UPI003AF2D271
MRPATASGTAHRNKKVTWLLAASFLVLLGAAAWALCRYVEQQAMHDLQRDGRTRAGYYSRVLVDSLEKYRHLPYVLARDARIRSLLKGELDEIRVNPHLEDFGAATGCLIFVLDKGGTTVAASNWRGEFSLLGQNFNFRPYFLDARRGDSGGYYAVGLRTRKPGYFISSPVYENGVLLGVVAVKVDLGSLQQSWRDGDETILVSDFYGVFILSTSDEYRYRTIEQLSKPTRKRLITNQYLEKELEVLPMVRQNSAFGNILEIGQDTYLETSNQLPEYGWRLHYLQSLAPVATLMRATQIAAIAASVIIFLMVLYLRERKAKQISLTKATEAEAVRELNLLLQKEVQEHKRTEKSLRETQRELIQTGKLAALGRMSAAVAHELNQPVTAIRTFLASCSILLERGRHDEVKKNLSLIGSLTDRMASITAQLKNFSRKNIGRSEPVDLVVCVENVLQFLSAQLAEKNIAVSTELLPKGCAVIQGHPVRVEQVVINLLVNSMDALKERDDGRVDIEITAGDGKARLQVTDNGAGIAADVMEYLFEPFFTTKQDGDGLGLGLSISYSILQELGATIIASNGDGGGACFLLSFPLGNNADMQMQ